MIKIKWIKSSEKLPKPKEDAKDFEKASGESDTVWVLLNGKPTTGVYHANIGVWSIPWHSGQGWKPEYWAEIEYPSEVRK